jgi:SAM-dependent methyltransferase
MNTFDPIWETLRLHQRALLLYPYDFVVVFVNRHFPKGKARCDTKILEVGCGAGNNLWFAAREGFNVTGIDGSNSAIEFARQRFAKEELAGRFDVGDFTNLPYADDAFDMAFDCGSLVCCGQSACRRAIVEIRRVLSPGGMFLFNPYSTRHSCFSDSEPGADGQRINIRGTMSGVGPICYYSREDVSLALGIGWEIISFEHCERVDDAVSGRPIHAEWRVIARKC